MWVFAIVIVLAMGGVAMVASGRGTPMSEAYDDSPDTLVPEGRPLAGADLRRVRFPLAFRGYRMAEVDALLDRLAGELDQRASEAASSEPAVPTEDGPDEPAVRPDEPTVRADGPTREDAGGHTRESPEAD